MEREEETNNMPDLPEDLISLEILSRLPIKTIHKWRAVCKLWYTLPHDAKFVKAHTDRSLCSSKIIILSYKIQEELSFVSFYSFDMKEGGNKTELLFSLPLYCDGYRMELSCNGLVCFSAVHREEVYVCNPATYELKQLPMINFYHREAYFPGTVAGFGVDELTKEYKVLFAFQSKVFNSSKCFLFTLGSIDAKWRQVDDIPYLFRAMQSACLNGTVYWLIERPGYPGPNSILSFSFHDETYQVLSVPTDWKSLIDDLGYQCVVHLKVIEGYLRIVTTLNGSDSDWWLLRCWTLKDPKNHVWAFEFKSYFNITSDTQRSHSPIPVDILNGKVLVSAGGKLYMLVMQGNVDPEEIICGIPDEDDVNIPKSYLPEYVESWTRIGVPRLGYRTHERHGVDKDKDMQALVDDIVGKY